MGANTFHTKATGKNAEHAFAEATREARFMHGHGGYTGTIAEKNAFVLLTPPNGEDPVDFAYRLIEEDDPRICNKWGPAGCVALGDNKYLFFGWASS